MLNRIKSPSLSIPFVSCCSPKKVRRKELNCLYIPTLPPHFTYVIVFVKENPQAYFTLMVRVHYLQLIASLLCREGKLGIKSKAGAIKRCKEIKITAPLNEWRNIQFSNEKRCKKIAKKATSLKTAKKYIYQILGAHSI